MKKLLVLVFTVLISIPVISQVNFGVKLGVNTSSITMADAKTVTSGSTSYLIEQAKGASYGVHGGLFVRVNISNFYIQPELLLATGSNEYTVTNVSSQLDSLKAQNFNKLDIPVMLGFKFGPLRINAGPSASLMLNSPEDLIKDPDFKTMYSNLSYGYQAGIGVDLLKKLTIDLRYEGSLKKYQNTIETTLGDVNLDDRPNSFLLSVGIIF
ncbi:MAG: PorT family protein [Bacteroidales bacterium]|nr:PorT family protein [Bacteroidales bacterium]